MLVRKTTDFFRIEDICRRAFHLRRQKAGVYQEEYIKRPCISTCGSVQVSVALY